MTEAIVISPYSPTNKEVVQGSRLACAPIYAGGWRFALIAYGVIQGLALGVACLGLSFLTARFFGPVPGDGGKWMYLIFIIYTLAYWSLERAIKRRGSAAYRNSLVMEGQTMRVDASGITFSNGRSQSFMDWRDFSGVQVTSQMIVPTLSNQGIVIADRMLALNGDVKEQRDLINGWYRAAQAGAA